MSDAAGALQKLLRGFFEHVEQGIILEDDCLPSLSFFTFCEELLDRYKQTQNVYLISGTNPLQQFSTSASYLFSRFAGIWGWASWRRAWKNYDYKMKSWCESKNKQRVNDFFENNDSAKDFLKRFEQTYLGADITWWDYQWLYCRIINNGLGIVPSKNLIKNLGFGDDATHTFNSEAQEAKLELSEIEWPLKHAEVYLDRDYDKELYKRFYKHDRSILVYLKRRFVLIKNIFIKTG